MRPDERNEGDYRIVARALPGPGSRGFVAAVTVLRVRGIADAPRDAYHDESLAGGYAWPSVEAARLYAIAKAQEVIREEAFRLSC
jgi:hypothetical protein